MSSGIRKASFCSLMHASMPFFNGLKKESIRWNLLLRDAKYLKILVKLSMTG